MKKLLSSLRIIIVIIWLIMVVQLIRKNIFFQPAASHDRELLSENIKQRQEWAGIYLKGNKIGYTSSRLKRLQDGYQFKENSYMDMTIMGLPQKMETFISAETDEQLLLRNFSFTLQSGIITFKAQGEVKDKAIKLKIDTGGEVQRQRIPISDKPSLVNTLKFSLLKDGLMPGKRFRRKFFDPLTMSTRYILVEVQDKEAIEIGGKSYSCYRIKETYKGIHLYSWIDENGVTFKEESPMGLVLIRESQDKAISMNMDNRRTDILTATAIEVNRPIPRQNLSFLKVRLKNVNLSNFALHGERQTLSKDTLSISLEDLHKVDSYTIPCKTEKFKEFLDQTPLIQCKNREINEQALKIIGDESDAIKVVKRLNNWVYYNIEKRPTLSVPSALEVLKTRRGDCNEHAVLLTALCRCVGIPAKLCAGIVYGNGKFFYHAWVEVYIQRWISIDPTMNQFPADVTHIKFIEGGIEKQLDILGIVGKLEIDILEYS